MKVTVCDSPECLLFECGKGTVICRTSLQFIVTQKSTHDLHILNHYKNLTKLLIEIVSAVLTSTLNQKNKQMILLNYLRLLSIARLEFRE